MGRRAGLGCRSTAAWIVVILASCGSDPAGPVDPSPQPSPDGPVLEAISADTLVAGDTVSISGRNFASGVSGNLVHIGTEPAIVTSVGDRQLVVVVPTGPCLPPRGVGITVTVDGRRSNELKIPLRPAEYLSLAPGQFLVRPATGSCLQFSGADGTEAYLLGVQRLSTDPTGSTSIELRGTTRAGLADAVSGEGGRVTVTGSRTSDIDHWKPLTGADTRGPSLRRSVLSAVDSTVATGDTIALRSVTPVSASCADWSPVDAVVRHVGRHAIWLEDTSNATGSFDDVTLEAMSDEFDDVTYAVDTEWFGDPGDFDGNERVVIVLSHVVNDIDPGLGGFVVGCDLFPRSAVSGSNEGEYLWLGPADPSGAYGPPTSPAQTRALLRRVVAHEFVHVIQFTRRRGTTGITPMGEFVTEGQALMGEEIVANEFLGIAPGANSGYAVAFNDPAMTATDWYADKFEDLSRYFGCGPTGTRVEGAPQACAWLDVGVAPCAAGRPLYYAVTWSLLRWIGDHHAETVGGEPALHRALIDSPQQGFSLIEDVVGLPMDSILPRWAAALYLDDRVPGLDPELTFPSWDLLDVFESPGQSGSTTGIAPSRLRFEDFSTTTIVASASTAYFLIEGDRRDSTALQISGGGGGNLASVMQIFVFRVK